MEWLERMDRVIVLHKLHALHGRRNKPCQTPERIA
jgi:hypothetical protein